MLQVIRINGMSIYVLNGLIYNPRVKNQPQFTFDDNNGQTGHSIRSSLGQ